MVALLGGCKILGVGWNGRRSVYVDFTSTYADKVHQLYAGRRLIGSTRSPGERRITGQLQPSASPPPLMLTAVDPTNMLVDYGSTFPPRPWNRYQFGWTFTDGESADAHHFDVTVGDAPDATPNTFAKRVPYIGDGNYQVDLPPFTESGAWYCRVTPYDNAKPAGNAGTYAQSSVNVIAYPPDVQVGAGGNRLTAALAGGVFTIGFTPPA